MRRTYVGIAAVALGALSACSSHQASGTDGGSSARVATLASAGAGAGPSAPSDSTRPRYRLDMTVDDQEALMVPYDKCLKEHGFTQLDGKLNMDDRQQGKALNSDKAKQLLACEQKYFPLPEWERDPANPRAADFQHAVTACLKARGVKMEGDAFAKDESLPNALELAHECELEAATKIK